MQPQRLSALLLGILLGGLGNGVAWAQAFITPSLTISEDYDDNIRQTSTKTQSDFVTRVSPGLRLEWKEYPWDVSVAGAFRPEIFARHTDLNTATENRDASAAVEFRPTPLVTLSLAENYIRSVNPETVTPRIRLIPGRFASTSNTVAPAVTYHLTPLTSARVGYSFDILRSEAPGSADSDTHQGDLSLQHQLTPRTSGTVRYTFTHFQVQGSPEQDAHFPRGGVAFAYSPTIRLSLEAGPLFLERPDGSLQVSWGGTTTYEQEFKQGRFSLGYDRNATVGGLLGAPGITQDLRAALILEPLRRLTVTLAGDGQETVSSGPAPARVNFVTASVGLRLTYRVLRWLSVDAGYRYERQDDRTGSLSLKRDVFSLSVTASEQFRAY